MKREELTKGNWYVATLGNEQVPCRLEELSDVEPLTVGKAFAKELVQRLDTLEYQETASDKIVRPLTSDEKRRLLDAYAAIGRTITCLPDLPSKGEGDET